MQIIRIHADSSKKLGSENQQKWSYWKPLPAGNLKKYNKNAKLNKDIFLYPKI